MSWRLICCIPTIRLLVEYAVIDQLVRSSVIYRCSCIMKNAHCTKHTWDNLTLNVIIPYDCKSERSHFIAVRRKQRRRTVMIVIVTASEAIWTAAAQAQAASITAWGARRRFKPTRRRMFMTLWVSFKNGWEGECKEVLCWSQWKTA
jgi:hypothetical protein